MKTYLAIALTLVMILTNPVLHAQASIVRKPLQELVEAIGRYAGRKGSSVVDELAKIGGERTVRRVGEKLFREGGDEALDRAVRMTRQLGPDVIRAVDNIPRPVAILRAVDQLPADIAPAALRRLAAGSEGRLLAQVTERVGQRALRAEVMHPGVGGALARHLGPDGADLALRANSAQALHLARHASDIARLPAQQREGLLRLLRQDFERVIRWIAQFIEKNPGKVLFTAGATTVILVNSEALLGGTSELVFDAEGNPIIVPRAGMIERILSPVLHRTLNWVLPIIATGLALWIGVRLWQMRRRSLPNRSDVQPTSHPS